MEINFQLNDVITIHFKVSLIIITKVEFKSSGIEYFSKLKMHLF